QESRAVARLRTRRRSRRSDPFGHVRGLTLDMALGADGDDDVGKAVDAGHEPRWHYGRRVLLVDDRRSLEHVPRLQRCAVVETGGDLLERAARTEPRLAL